MKNGFIFYSFLPVGDGPPALRISLVSHTAGRKSSCGARRGRFWGAHRRSRPAASGLRAWGGGPSPLRAHAVAQGWQEESPLRWWWIWREGRRTGDAVRDDGGRRGAAEGVGDLGEPAVARAAAAAGKAAAGHSWCRRKEAAPGSCESPPRRRVRRQPFKALLSTPKCPAKGHEALWL